MSIRRNYVARRRPHRGLVWVLVTLHCGCTYDFDQFGAQHATNAAGANATTAAAGRSTGGGGTVAVPLSGGTTMTASGGATGTASAGGATSTSTIGGGAGATTAPPCAGALYNGICWYMGASGASCQQTCTTHGQPATSAATFVGSRAQGGSAAECGTLLRLLGISASLQTGTRSDGLGLGCHVYQNTFPWWLTSPDYSATAAGLNSKLVCGCTQ